MLNIEGTSRLSRVVVLVLALAAAYVAGLLVSGQSLVLRILVSVLVFVLVGAIGLRLAPKRS
jgi:hypothetical protein